MDSFFLRFKNTLVLVILLLLQTVGLAIQVRRPAEPDGADSARVTFARSWVVAIFTPLERVIHHGTTSIRSTWSDYLDLRNTRQQNLALRRDLDQMRLEQASIAEDAIQGHRLQSLLAFQQHYVDATVVAQVIGTSGTDLSRVLYIDKGAADGLKPDLAVITPDGIVGKVREVYPQTAPHTAQILLINDQTSGAGVILATTRIRAVLRGTTAGFLQISNLTPDDRIKPGEQVVSSGGDQVFPRGLPVGTIESIAPDPDHQPYTAIRVRPAANISRLEEVLIITGTRDTLPPSSVSRLTQAAAASAEARAAAAKAAAAKAAADQTAREEAARSAAEVVADRLPNLDDPNTTPAEKEAAAKAAALALASPRTAGGTIPRPLPPIRTDRYSPGTTPPADALTPGGRHSPPSSPPASATPPQP